MGRSRATVGRAVASLARFGTSLQGDGLNAAVKALGLADLRGCSATEAVARIAEHLAESSEGLASDVLIAALRDSILEAAAIQGDPTYENLEASLQEFLKREGIEGLIEGFLTHLVFCQVWTLIEQQVGEKADGTAAEESLSTAVEGVCRNEVHSAMDAAKKAGQFEQTSWFGRGGQRIGQAIVADLEARLKALAE